MFEDLPPIEGPKVGNVKLSTPDEDLGRRVIAEGDLHQTQEGLVADLYRVTTYGKSSVGGGSPAYGNNWDAIFKKDTNN